MSRGGRGQGKAMERRASARLESEERVFKALGDARRRRILDLLRSEPHTTGEICAEFPELDRCSVMQHIAILARADLILVRREGRLRWNYLNPIPIKEIYERWINPYASNALALLARMKRDMEG